MILVILQCVNFMWAVFFMSNPLIAIFAGAVLGFLCVLAFSACES
jgi:hypothetical protein